VSKTLSWLLLVIVAVASQGCSSCGGCSCGSKKSATPAAGEPDDGSGAVATPTPKRASGNKPPTPPPTRARRRAAVPVTPDEVTAALPTIPGSTLLGPAQAMPSSNQLRLTYCIDQADTQAAAETISTALTAGGWTDVRVRPNPRGIPRVAVGGKKDDFRLNGQISPGAAPQCDGKTLAKLSVFKIGEAAEGDDVDLPVDPREPGAGKMPRLPGVPRVPDRLGGPGAVGVPRKPAPGPALKPEKPLQKTPAPAPAPTP
jgi:hypothetical protein